ncbi:MAG TPA: ribosome maturation factor RimP [Candidatus Acetothermia bacterium]|nr:ribosome maturation factor RimP [Candidatus Acetothermia bacterium]
MDRVQEKLDALVHQGAADAQVEVYHWELRRWGQRARLLVQVDRPGGVTVDDCARASRAIEALLDEVDPVPCPYVLEVSSPGLERGLWEPRHYAQAVGRLVHVKLKTDATRRGRLVRATPDAITLAREGAELDIPVADIVRAHLVYEREGR